MPTRRLSVRDLDVRGRRIFVRVDLNAPLRDGAVADDTRLRAALPTLRHILERGGRVIAASHLGRPKGKAVPSMSLAPVAGRLRALLGRPVRMAPDCVGAEVEALAGELPEGEVLLLENLRFHAGEEANDGEFAARLARLADLYVNDAFGTAHRAHASVVGITRHLPAAAGFLMEREMEMLHRLLERPRAPYVAILGGAKVSDKLDLLRILIGRVDAILIGGAMAYTFLKAGGTPVGSSRVEADRLEHAAAILDRAGEAGIRFLLPVDHVVAPSPEPGAPSRATPGPGIPEGLAGVDVGPRTRELYRGQAKEALTIFWNGPLGLFEVEPYGEGTRTVAEAIDAGRTFGVVGGGDSVAAMNRLGLADHFTHLSTGGGAALEYLAGVDLPGVRALGPAEERPARDRAR
ncbi:MAG: phosphoglycerate kinase [Acidobacteriota bacterium]